MMNSFYNPDVLECLANLSNDEVFTPPDIANEMLNKLPKILFERPDTTFFDPACKSGIFLREITKRLIIGTEHLYPDRQTCVDHILKKQVFGMAITEMTSYLSRRSLYCSKYPDQQFSVTKFESPNGEIFYKRVNHEWQNGRCILCGASQEKFDRSETFENYAYPFIHGEDPEKIFNMKFDVIISNPPYHLSDGGQKASATPLYQKFVSQAKKLNPKFLMMIIPARWYSGGRGLETFRKEMLNDDRIEYLIDYTDSNDCFPGVDIAGGICYFLWNRNYHGKCKITNFYQQKHFNSIRPLNQYDSFLRYSEALAIIQKVQKNERKFYNSIVSSQKPFGLRTYVKPEATGDILLRYSGGTGKFSRDKVTNGREWIDKWKVIISYLTYDHAGRPDKDGKRKILSTN